MEMSEFATELSERLRSRRPEGVGETSRLGMTQSTLAFALSRSMLETVGESLCDATDAGIGCSVLDVAGNHASLVAARRGADVVVRPMQDIGAALRPLRDGAFDVVLSAFGPTLAADDLCAASQLLRVCRQRGRVGLAQWVPSGFMGRLLTLVESYAPANMGRVSPTPWTSEDGTSHLFCSSVCDVSTTRHTITFRYTSAEEWVDELRSTWGPVLKVFERLPIQARQRLEDEILYLIDDFNVSRNTSVLVPSEYVQIVIAKK